jgi:hypothetical protein
MKQACRQPRSSNGESVMTNKAIETANLFFRNLGCSHMSSHEVEIYTLKLQREALVRDANAYHRARLDIQSAIKPGPALDAALQTLHRKYPMGYCRTELLAVNAAILKATVALQHFKASNLKDGEHFSTRRINTGGLN